LIKQRERSLQIAQTLSGCQLGEGHRQPLILASEGCNAGTATVAFDAAVKRLVVTKRKHLREYGWNGHARRRSGTPWLEKPARSQNGAHPKISVKTSSNEFYEIKLTRVPDNCD
jgi:hypothetical protein